MWGNGYKLYLFERPGEVGMQLVGERAVLDPQLSVTAVQVERSYKTPERRVGLLLYRQWLVLQLVLQ